MRYEQLQKEVFLLEHGFYDEEIGKDIQEWANGRESTDGKWLEDYFKNELFPFPRCEKDKYDHMLNELAMGCIDTQLKNRIVSREKIRRHWFRKKHPGEFRGENR